MPVKWKPLLSGAFGCYHCMTWLNITKNPLAPCPKAPAKPINIHTVHRYILPIPERQFFCRTMQIYTVLASLTLRGLRRKNIPSWDFRAFKQQNLITDSVLECSLSFLEQEQAVVGPGGQTTHMFTWRAPSQVCWIMNNSDTGNSFPGACFTLCCVRV